MGWDGGVFIYHDDDAKRSVARRAQERKNRPSRPRDASGVEAVGRRPIPSRKLPAAGWPAGSVGSEADHPSAWDYHVPGVSSVTNLQVHSYARKARDAGACGAGIPKKCATEQSAVILLPHFFRGADMVPEHSRARVQYGGHDDGCRRPHVAPAPRPAGGQDCRRAVGAGRPATIVTAGGARIDRLGCRAPHPRPAGNFTR